MWQGKRSSATQMGLVVDECLTVEVFQGILGVQWIEFVDQTDANDKPRIGNCFNSPALENLRHH